MVTCPLCELEFKRISASHLRNKHQLSMQDFRLQFPNTVLTSEDTRALMSESSKKSGCGKWRKGVKLSDEHRLKLSVVNSGEKNKFNGKHHSKETRERMSNNHADFTGDKNPFRIAMRDEEFKMTYLRDRKMRFEQRKMDMPSWYFDYCHQRSLSACSAIESGKLRSYGRGHKAGYIESVKAGHVWCRSSYEAKFLSICDELEIVSTVESCKLRIEYVDEVGKLRRYLPDFRVNGSIIVEIKAAGLVNEVRNLCKFEAARDYCVENGLKFIVLTNPIQFRFDLEDVINGKYSCDQWLLR